MGSRSRSHVYLGIIPMVLLSISSPTRGANSSASNDCINAILPCQNYLNTTGRPPNSCCSPLVSQYTNNKACLCSLLNDKTLIKEFNINITQAAEVPVRCGLNVTISSCSNVGGNSTTASGSPPPPPANKSALSSPSFEILSLLALLLLGVAAQVYQ